MQDPGDENSRSGKENVPPPQKKIHMKFLLLRTKAYKGPRTLIQSKSTLFDTILLDIPRLILIVPYVRHRRVRPVLDLTYRSSISQECPDVVRISIGDLIVLIPRMPHEFQMMQQTAGPNVDLIDISKCVTVRTLLEGFVGRKSLGIGRNAISASMLWLTETVRLNRDNL